MEAPSPTEHADPAHGPRPTPSPARRDRAHWPSLLSALALIAIPLWVYAPFADLGLLGFDTFPTILTARIESLSDLWGTFHEELMDGRFRVGGHFFRPLTNLSFAFDHARGGLAPSAYHQTDFAILVGGGLALYACGLRLFGRRHWAAALFAGLAFLLHPLQVDVLPVPPRRADLLAIGLALACVAAQPRVFAAPNGAAARGMEASSRTRSLVGALLALGAMAAKESGVVVVPLVLGLHALEGLRSPAGGGPWRALRGSLHASRAVLAAFAGFAVWRTLALGGLGGYEDSSWTGVAKFWRLTAPYFDQVLLPAHYEAPATWIFGALGLLAIASAWLLLTARRRADHTAASMAGADESPSRAVESPAEFELQPTALQPTALPPTALVLPIGCLVCLLAIHGSAGDRVEPWYAAVFCAPVALWFGALVAGAAEAIRRRQIPLALVAGLPPLMLVGWNLATLRTLRADPTWARASEASSAFLERFDTELDAARLGTNLVFDRLPIAMPPPPADQVGVRSAVMLNTYTLEAYAELTRPDVKIRVHTYQGQPNLPRPAADEIVVWLTPMALPPRPGFGGAAAGGGR